MSDKPSINHQGAKEATRQQIDAVLWVLCQHRGKQNAIKRGLLLSLAGLGDSGRTLTAARHQINLDQSIPEVVGVDIASGSYYLCQTSAEVAETEAYDRTIGLTHLESANAIQRKAARATAQQPAMFDLFEVPA